MKAYKHTEYEYWLGGFFVRVRRKNRATWSWQVFDHNDPKIRKSVGWNHSGTMTQAKLDAEASIATMISTAQG